MFKNSQLENSWQNLCVPCDYWALTVDNAISELDYQSSSLENVKRSLLFNTKSIVSCIRMFKELGIDSRFMSKKELNIDQQYLVELYKIIDSRENSSFCFERVEEQDIVEKAIDEVGEDLKVVCKRFLDSGMTPEQVAKRMDVPIKFVKGCMR